MKPISVLMSVYNEPPDWLNASIESILKQTFGEFEFIIINDNPAREELRDMLKKYGDQDQRIRIIDNRENLGPAGAKNNGLCSAVGRYVAIMDADDISLPGRLKYQYHFLEKNSDIFLVGTSVQIIGQNGLPREKVIKRENHKQIVENMFAGRLPLYHPTIMFRNKEGFSYRDKFRVTLDYDYYLNILSKGERLGNLKNVLLKYRVSNKSISANKRRKQILYGKLALKFYYERLETGSDSYDELDFGDEDCLLRFLGVTADELEREALRKSIVFALAAGDVEAAKQAFCNYKRYDGPKADKFMLSLFVKFPRLHGFYRKLRYEILRF